MQAVRHSFCQVADQEVYSWRRAVFPGNACQSAAQLTTETREKKKPICNGGVLEGRLNALSNVHRGKQKSSKVEMVIKVTICIFLVCSKFHTRCHLNILSHCLFTTSELG